MKDSWESGNPYEYFMGRWSRLVAQGFLSWLSPDRALKWLDAGCGSGALSEAAMQGFEPKELIAIDQSEGFVVTAQNRLGSGAICKVGNVVDLPLEDFCVDLTVSGLVLNFIADPGKFLAEMKRVTTIRGTVAVYVWDYAGKMDFLQHFWETAAKIKLEAKALDESTRFPDCNPDSLARLFKDAGFEMVVTAPIDIETRFIDFDDYWKPFLGGQGPAPTFTMALEDSERESLKDLLQKRLPVQPDGSISLFARAWAVKGRVGD